MAPDNTPSLSAAQIALMQTTVNNSLPDLCSIIRNVSVSNGAGGTVDTPTVIHSNVPVRYGPFRVPMLEQEALDATRIDSKSRWEFVFPIGTDVLITDRVQINGGLTYEVASPRSPQSFGLYVFFLCELVE